MRKHKGLVAIAIAVSTIAACEARASASSPAEAGYPVDLINTPVCAVVESFDEPRNCTTTFRLEGKSRAPDRAIR